MSTRDSAQAKLAEVGAELNRTRAALNQAFAAMRTAEGTVRGLPDWYNDDPEGEDPIEVARDEERDRIAVLAEQHGLPQFAALIRRLL